MAFRAMFSVKTKQIFICIGLLITKIIEYGEGKGKGKIFARTGHEGPEGE
jgi:hypothetical protein